MCCSCNKLTPEQERYIQNLEDLEMAKLGMVFFGPITFILWLVGA